MGTDTTVATQTHWKHTIMNTVIYGVGQSAKSQGFRHTQIGEPDCFQERGQMEEAASLLSSHVSTPGLQIYSKPSLILFICTVKYQKHDRCFFIEIFIVIYFFKYLSTKAFFCISLPLFTAL